MVYLRFYLNLYLPLHIQSTRDILNSQEENVQDSQSLRYRETSLKQKFLVKKNIR